MIKKPPNPLSKLHKKPVRHMEGCPIATFYILWTKPWPSPLGFTLKLSNTKMRESPLIHPRIKSLHVGTMFHSDFFLQWAPGEMKSLQILIHSKKLTIGTWSKDPVMKLRLLWSHQSLPQWQQVCYELLTDLKHGQPTFFSLTLLQNVGIFGSKGIFLHTHI